MANFRIRTAGRKWGPNRSQLDQRTPSEGKNGSKRDQKAAQTVPEWASSKNGDTQPLWCPPQSRQAPLFGDFGPFWAYLGPGVFGRAEAQRGRETGMPGPKDGLWGPRTQPGDFGTPPGSIVYGAILGPPVTRWG